MGWKNVLAGHGGKFSAATFMEEFWWDRPGPELEVVVNVVLHQCSGGRADDAYYFCLRTGSAGVSFLSSAEWYHLGGLLGVRGLAAIQVRTERWKPFLQVLRGERADSWPTYGGDPAREDAVRNGIGYYAQSGEWDWKMLVVTRDGFMVNAAGAETAPKGLAAALSQLNTVVRDATLLGGINGWGPEGQPRMWLDCR